MATSSLKTVLETMFDSYGLGRYSTNTGTSASAFTADAALGGSDGARRIDVGCALYVTGGSSGSAPDDEETRLSSRPKLATGVANLDPALTVALANADTFAVAYKDLTFKAGSGPYAILPAINDALTLFHWDKRIVPVTRAADGDMLASAETDWTLSGATDSKTAATFALFGERAITVTDTGAAGGYTSTGNIAVEEGETYYLEVTGWGTDSADAGELRLIDVTNSSATITLDNSVIDRIEPETLVNPSVTIPSGCEQVDIRLISTNASDVVSWSNLIFRKNESRVHTLADRPQRIMRIGQVRATTETTWSRRNWDRMQPIEAETHITDAGLWQLHLSDSVAGKAVFYEEFVAPGDLSTAAGTTTVDADDLAAVASVILLEPLRRERYWGDMYRKASMRAAQVSDRYMAQNRTVVNQTPRAYPLLKV